jgi:antitoxin MazE
MRMYSHGQSEMEARIRKWGNSLAVRIPQSIATQIDLQPDSPVNLTISGSDLTISPIRRSPVILEDLLDRVTDDNLHKEADFGPPVGDEVW